MILAAYGDGLHKVLFLGHMLSFVVAFAPAVINPILVAKVKGDGDDGALVRLAGHMAGNGRQIHFPALIALGAFGLAMVLTSDDVIGFGDTWVSLAFLVWLAICGVISGIVLPSEKKLAAGDLEAEKKVAMGGQIATVLTLVMLYLMIWKPGA
jgi:uncharacterized membrane protein